ncbi:MAG: hypothetical protein LBH00_05975 [Planctomycetaceae bacterium]|jgi:DNA-binding ferritin-like protein|nr:hypothetical protein [Planctomycetaceae bacterium]
MRSIRFLTTIAAAALSACFVTAVFADVSETQGSDTKVSRVKQRRALKEQKAVDAAAERLARLGAETVALTSRVAKLDGGAAAAEGLKELHFSDWNAAEEKVQIATQALAGLYDRVTALDNGIRWIATVLPSLQSLPPKVFVTDVFAHSKSDRAKADAFNKHLSHLEKRALQLNVRIALVEAKKAEAEKIPAAPAAAPLQTEE